jgi:hypothetical protein
MYHHVKKLMYTVQVDEADPRFGNMTRRGPAKTAKSTLVARGIKVKSGNSSTRRRSRSWAPTAMATRTRASTIEPRVPQRNRN